MAVVVVVVPVVVVVNVVVYIESSFRFWIGREIHSWKTKDKYLIDALETIKHIEFLNFLKT